MQKKSIDLLFWIGMSLLSGAVGAALLAGHLRHLWGTYVRGDPVLEMLTSSDLGQCEFGQTVEARFSVANRGRGDLVLDSFRSNCACNAIEWLRNGQSFRLDQIRLAPDEHAELVLRMSVRSRVGEEIQNVVYFRTNDPHYPEASFVARMQVAGGITVTPASVLFGSVSIGSESRQVLEVSDNAINPRHIIRVVSSNPNIFPARLLPPVTEAKASKPGKNVLLGRIEVTLCALEPGHPSGEVLIFVDDEQRPPHSISISGRVAPVVEVSPSICQLPRESNTGPQYFATCVCRSTSGSTLTLTLESAPPHISVKIAPLGSNPSAQLVRIDYDVGGIGSDSPLARNKASVRLRAQVGKDQLVVEIPVKLRTASLR